ncbi:hypothetical protein D3C72_2184830 [compost metagenome]
MHDVGVGGRDFRRQPAEHAALVARDDVQAGGQVLGGVGVPADVDPAFGFAQALAQGHRAIGGVHHQPMAHAHAGHDGVARQRAAARRKLDRLAFVALDQDGSAAR